MGDRLAIEKVVHAFLEKRRRRFSVDDLVIKLEERFGEEALPDLFGAVIETLVTSPLVFYDENRDDYVPRRTFFKGKRFVVQPTAEELREGYLIPGHRFMPFLPLRAHPAAVTVTLPDERRPETRFIERNLRDLEIYFSLFSGMTVFEYVAADDQGNATILESAKGLDRPVRIRVIDLADWFRETGFREGDRILVTVLDWDAGRLTFEHDRSLISDSLRLAWSASLESALIEHVFEMLGPTTNLHDQLAYAFFTGDKKLLDHPRLHIGGFLGHLRKVQITRINGEPLFWYADSAPEDALMALAEMGLDHEIEDPQDDEELLVMMGLPFGSDELEAYMLDELFRGGDDLDAVIRRVVGGRPQHAARAEQHLGMFHQLAGELWDDVAAEYNRFSDQRSGRCRAEALAVLDAVLASLVSLDEREGEIADPANKDFVELSGMISVLTQMIISLNYAELSLEEMNEVLAGIQQISARTREIIAALEPEPPREKRAAFRLIRGGQGLADRLYLLEIVIEDTDPKVWRRLEVTADTGLGDLHHIISVLFGRRGKLSHVFRFGDALYGDVKRQGALILGIEDESDMLLGDLVGQKGDELRYEYHIADCQAHIIRVVSVSEAKGKVKPRCIDGAGQAPPEAKSEFPFLSGKKGAKVPIQAKPYDKARINKKLKTL